MMATLPALPVDETRYLTVAWEMRLSGDWLLPTLNGEPYSHKAPLLFWLINLVWSALGPSVWSARLVPVAATAAVFVLTWRLGRELFADRGAGVTSLAVVLLAGPATFVYGAFLCDRGPGPAITHMVLLTDARQVNDELLALVRNAHHRVNGARQ